MTEAPSVPEVLINLQLLIVKRGPLVNTAPKLFVPLPEQLMNVTLFNVIETLVEIAEPNS